MAEFINTADVIGDDEMCDQILMRTVTEYKENRVTRVGKFAFYMCNQLEVVDLPNVLEIGQYAFGQCSGSYFTVRSPMATLKEGAEFNQSKSLVMADIHGFSPNQSNSFYGCSSLAALIIRSNELSTILNTQHFASSNISAGRGYIYVPRALVDSYKAATNWSTYANQFRALEDYTIDGTVTGKFKGGLVIRNVHRATIDGPTGFVMGSYNANVIPVGNSELVEVSVVMDGVDITDSVYSNGIINIPEVAGDIVITAKSNSPYDIVSVPLNGAEYGDLPVYRLDVKAGQKLRLHYYLTKNSGYIYDGRGCGTGYDNSGHTVNAPATQDVTIASNGRIVFSGYHTDQSADGTLVSNANDRLSGKYLYVEILE